MRDLDRQPRIDFSARPIDQVASWLDKRTCCHAVGLVLGSAALVTGLDLISEYYQMRLATLYIVPISLACWLFKPRNAVAVTVALTLAAFAQYGWLERSSPQMLIANGSIRALAFGLLAAIVLGFRRSFDLTRITASRDRLTGALNKAAFQQRAQLLLDDAGRAGGRVLLIYLDLDGFKAINDRYGHHEGDKVLELFSAGVGDVLRRDDCFGRLGGDEFAVAMPVHPDQEIQELAETLHQRFSTTLRDSGHPVTCSMGALSVSPGTLSHLGELLSRADQLMYMAKNGGKDDFRFDNVASTSTASSRAILIRSIGETSEVVGSA